VQNNKKTKIDQLLITTKYVIYYIIKSHNFIVWHQLTD